MPKRMAAIDIGISSVRILELIQASPEQMRLCNIIDRKKEAHEPLSNVIKNMFLENNLKADLTLVSLPMQLVTVRKLSVPFKEREKITRIIRFEIEPLIPYSIKDMIVDFYQIQEEPAGSTLIVACAEKMLIDQIKKGLSKVASGLRIISLDSFCLFATYIDSPAYQADKIIALININNDRVLIDIAGGGSLLFMRSLTPSPEITKDIVFSLRAFELEAGKRIDGILLNVEDAQPEMKKEALSKELNIEISQFVPGRAIMIPWDSYRGEKRLFVGTGLALIGLKNAKDGIDFLREVSWKEKLVRLKPTLLPTAVLLAGIILLLMANLYIRLFIKASQQRFLKTQTRKIFLQTFPEVKNVVEEVAQAGEKVQEAKTLLADFEGLVGEQGPVLELLRELSIRIPSRFYVNITTIEIKDNNITLTGDVQTRLAVEGIVRELSSSVRFKDIKIEKSEVVSDGYVNFKITLAAK